MILHMDIETVRNIMRNKKVLRQFEANLEACWVWESHAKGLYVEIRVNKKRQGVHRHVYEMLCGPIPKGLTIDHLCRNERCVRPSHLEAVPQGVNSLRGFGLHGVNARKVRCPKGHPLPPYKPGFGRTCQVCYPYSRAYLGKGANKGMSSPLRHRPKIVRPKRRPTAKRKTASKLQSPLNPRVRQAALLKACQQKTRLEWFHPSQEWAFHDGTLTPGPLKGRASRQFMATSKILSILPLH